MIKYHLVAKVYKNFMFFKKKQNLKCNLKKNLYEPKTESKTHKKFEQKKFKIKNISNYTRKNITVVKYITFKFQK